MPSITPESRDYDYDNEQLEERRNNHRRGEDTDMFASFSEGAGSTWINILLRAIGLVGVPSAIAMFLVYQNSTWGPRIQAMELNTQTDVAQLRKIQDQQAVKQDQTYRLLQRICANTAKTDGERQRCFDN
jgi:flagellar basal body-associated protein FliL